MKAATSTITPEIDVQALRVGMFVHLDVGWMSHPFPLSSFRITTAGAGGDDPLARPARGCAGARRTATSPCSTAAR